MFYRCLLARPSDPALSATRIRPGVFNSLGFRMQILPPLSFKLSSLVHQRFSVRQLSRSSFWIFFAPDTWDPSQLPQGDGSLEDIADVFTDFAHPPSRQFWGYSVQYQYTLLSFLLHLSGVFKRLPCRSSLRSSNWAVILNLVKAITEVALYDSAPYRWPRGRKLLTYSIISQSPQSMNLPGITTAKWLSLWLRYPHLLLPISKPNSQSSRLGMENGKSGKAHIKS